MLSRLSPIGESEDYFLLFFKSRVKSIPRRQDNHRENALYPKELEKHLVSTQAPSLKGEAEVVVQAGRRDSSSEVLAL